MQSRFPEEFRFTKRGTSLRILLIYPFVILIVVAVILTGFLSLYNSGKAAEYMAWQLMGEIAARIEDRVSRFLDRAHLVNDINANTIESGQIDLNNMREQELHFWHQVRSFEYISYSYIGRADGGFFGARRLGDGTLQSIATETLTGGKILYFNTDNQGLPTTISSSLPYYDHKTRPWYKAGIEAGKPTWSPVFIDAGGEGLTITAATPLYDASRTIKGVLGCSFSFSHINQFLQRLKIGESGLTFILERSGTLVATSTSDATYTADKKRIASLESDNPKINQTGKSISEQFGDLSKIEQKQRLSIDVQGEGYFVQLSPLTDHRGIDWLIVVIVPENDFMSHIKAGNVNTVLLSLLALGVTVVVGFTIARRITKPILELNIAARSLAEGDWSHELKIDRRDEVGELARSFNLMVKNLQNTTVSRDRLAEEIEERKKIESELQRLAAVVEHSSELVNLASLDGKMIFLNEAGAILLGIPPRDVEDHSIMEIIPDELKYKVQHEVLPAMLKEGRWEGELQYRNLITGTLTDVHAMTFTIRNSDGQPLYLANVSLDITERKRAEEALRASETFLEAIIEHSPHSMWVSDHKGTLIRMNQACRDLLHVTDEDLVGKYNVLEDNIVEEQGAMPLVKRVFEHGEMVRFILNYDTSQLRSLRLREMMQVVLEVTISPVMDAQKRVVHAIIQHLDITERKRAEGALQVQEERLRLAMEATQQGWFDLNVQTGEVSVSPEYAKIIGYEPSEFETNLQGWIDGLHPEDRDALLKAFRECVETGGTRTMEYRRRTKTGEWKWIRSMGKIVGFDSGNKPLRMAGTHADISEYKRTQEALRESQERFKELAELLPETIFEMDTSGNITYVNQHAFDHFGFSEEDLERGLNAFDMISPEDRPRALENANRVMSGQKIGINEYKVLRKDGNALPAIIHTAAKFRDGKPVAFRGIIIDITETKKLEADLRQAQKMEAIGTLAGGIAHDFNNILAAIIGYSEIIKVKFDKPALHDYLEKILASCDRAKSLVGQILSFSRVTEQERRPIDMASLMKEGLKLLRATLPSSIEIRDKITSDTHTVFADPTQMHQILINLCTNAAHAMRERGGELEVSLNNVETSQYMMPLGVDLSPGLYVKLTVGDTGTGIPPELMHRIFDPFFTTKMTGEGTGLGLSVVYGIVKGCGGTVTVQSKPGVGSVFSVYLPAIANTARVTVDDAGPIPRGKDRILFVDDEEILVEMTKELLEDLGYQATATTDSTKALELFRSQPDQFDLIITDMTMPVMTGIDLSKEILKLRPGIPIILCTGFNELISEEKARALGIRGFAMKPLSLRNIAELIRKNLEREGS